MRHALRDPVTHKFIAAPKTVEAMQHDAMVIQFTHPADVISATEQEIVAEQDAVLAHVDDPEASTWVPAIACCAFIVALVAIGVWRWLHG